MSSSANLIIFFSGMHRAPTTNPWEVEIARDKARAEELNKEKDIAKYIVRILACTLLLGVIIYSLPL